MVLGNGGVVVDEAEEEAVGPDVAVVAEAVVVTGGVVVVVGVVGVLTGGGWVALVAGEAGWIGVATTSSFSLEMAHRK